MKPAEEETKDETTDTDKPITGDVIGETAYSERFVLKILIKFANLDSLKDEIEEESFEEDLCTLWDMTAEKDVVEFLQKHNTLTLFQFALPTIKLDRIIEIILGIIGNMCCVKNVAESLLCMDGLLDLVMDYLSSSNAPTLVQVLRLVNACLFIAEGDNIIKWLQVFEKAEYVKSLTFFLQNSSNKELLLNSLENFNTICSQCNTEQCKEQFFTQFVNIDMFNGITTAFMEVTVKHKKYCNKEEYERVLAITLQILLHLIGFDTSPELFQDSTEDVADIIKIILNHFEDTFVKKKQIDSDLVDIFDSIFTVVNVLNISCNSNLCIFFNQSYKIWNTCSIILNPKHSRSKDGKENDIEVNELVKKLRLPLSNLICKYIQSCKEENLYKVMEKIGKDFDEIVSSCGDKTLQETIYERTSFRKRIEENGD